MLKRYIWFYVQYSSLVELFRAYDAIISVHQQEKPTPILDDDDDEVEALKDRLKAYRLDSSPDQSTGKLLFPFIMLYF